MTVLVISGPEKAGKTTLISVIRDQTGARVRPWQRIDDGTEFLTALKEDVADPGLVVWDRSWACENVYSDLMRRDNRVGSGWLAEWYMGRAVQAKGLRVIWTGPTWERLQERRTPDDLPVPPRFEQLAYLEYGHEWGWRTVDLRYCQRHEEIDVAGWARAFVTCAEMQSPIPPPLYAGPWPPPVLVLGDRRNERSTGPYTWLPFSTRTTTQFARCFGNDAFMCGWGNVEDFPWHRFAHLMSLGRTALVVACGKTAAETCAEWLKQAPTNIQLLCVPHPSALYRWGRYRSEIPVVEKRVQDAVRSVLSSQRKWEGYTERVT